MPLFPGQPEPPLPGSRVNPSAASGSACASGTIRFISIARRVVGRRGVARPRLAFGYRLALGRGVVLGQRTFGRGVLLNGGLGRGEEVLDDLDREDTGDPAPAVGDRGVAGLGLHDVRE